MGVVVGGIPDDLDEAGKRVTEIRLRLGSSRSNLGNLLDRGRNGGSPSPAYSKLDATLTLLDRSMERVEQRIGDLYQQSREQSGRSRARIGRSSQQGGQRRPRTTTSQAHAIKRLSLMEVKDEHGNVVARPRANVETWKDPETGKIMAKFRDLENLGFEEKKGWTVTLKGGEFYETEDGRFVEGTIRVTGRQESEYSREFSSKDAREHGLKVPELDIGAKSNDETGYKIAEKTNIPCNSTIVVRVGQDGMPFISEHSNGCDPSAPSQRMTPSATPSSRPAVQPVQAGNLPAPILLHPAHATTPQQSQPIGTWSTIQCHTTGHEQSRALLEELRRKVEQQRNLEIFAPGGLKALLDSIRNPPADNPKPSTPPR